MKIEIFQPLAIYELGQRANQEDSLWPNPEKANTQDRLFLVCDGMGGHEKGEVASQTVCQSIGAWFQENTTPNTPFNDNMLREALAHAYTLLDAKDDGSAKKMGTTLTLLYIHAQGVTAAHIGDSRIYHIRPQKGLLYVSRDHSLVFDLYQSGEISYEEMRTSSQKNIITRAMQPGEDNRVRPDIIHITDVQAGDWFYLCSDGMLEEMSDEELLMLLTVAEASDIERKEELIRATADNHDNHTAWMIHVKEVLTEESDKTLVNEEPTARCNALNIKPAVSEETLPVQQPVDNDVEVVSIPQSKTQKNGKLARIALLLLACIIGFVVWAFFTRSNEKATRYVHPKPMSIKKRIKSKKDTTKKTVLMDSVKVKPIQHKEKDKGEDFDI